MITAPGRTGPLDCQVRLAGSGGAQPGWDEFVAAEGLPGLWGHDLLQTMAESPSPFSPTFTAMVRHRDAIVGAFVGSYRGVRPQRGPGRRGPLLVDMRMPGQAHTASFHVRGDLSAGRRRSVLRAFERGLIRAFGPARLTGVCYRNATEPLLTDLDRPGAVLRESKGLGTMLRLPETFEEYWRGLSKNRRSSLRRAARRIDSDLDVQLSTGRTDIDPDEAVGLFAAGRYPALGVDPRPLLPAAYLRELTARHDVRTLTYRRRGELVGFGTCLADPRHPWASLWAMRHPGDGGYPHLFFDHWLRYLRQAIPAGASTFSAGRGYVTDKRRLGFGTFPLHFVAVPRPVMG